MFLTILGFLSGIIGGMGMGGGTILIPALILFAHIDPKIAQSVNLLSSIPMTIFALIIHIKNKKVNFYTELTFLFKIYNSPSPIENFLHLYF